MAQLSINDALQNLIRFIFSTMTVGGILMIAYGMVMIVRAFSGMGDDGDPHAMTKGVGFVMGGITMCCIRYLVRALTGSDPTSYTFIEGV